MNLEPTSACDILTIFQNIQQLPEDEADTRRNYSKRVS
jgi:hypothetical protein